MREIRSTSCARPSWLALSVVLLSGSLGCASDRMPAPEMAVDAYLRAAESGDEKALRSMMTERSRAALSGEELAGLLKRDHAEFVARRKSFSPGGHLEPEARATFYLSGGRTVSLELEDGQFRVLDTAGLLAQPRTPEEAAQQLRAALAARDYGRILATLNDDARASFAEVFDRLERTLKQLDTAIVEVGEDRATIEFDDGRILRLTKDENTWHVEEIE